MGYNLNMSCSGAPIIDANGGLLGVLDASSVNCNDTRVIQRHTMALVSMSASLIARYHFLREFPHAWILRFHSRPEFVGLLHEALVAVSGDGTILAVNESALTQLGHPDRKTLVGSPIEDVFQFHGFNEGRCAVRNPKRGISFVLRWPADIFPYLWCWQVCGGSFGYPYYGRTYTLAVEPFNCPIQGLAKNAEAGAVPTLLPGASVQARLEAGVETVASSN